MNCPVCDGENLVMSERQGIEVDYCPKCRGVWLDRGELDKIIERSAPEKPREPESSYRRPESDYRQPRERYDDDYKYHHKKKKRGGFLGELFDFD